MDLCFITFGNLVGGKSKIHHVKLNELESKSESIRLTFMIETNFNEQNSN